MLTFEIKPESIAGVEKYLEETKLRILLAIRAGMQQATAGLAAHTAENAPKRAGILAEVLAKSSSEIFETEDQIRGIVGRPSGFSRHILRWLESGAHNPAFSLMDKYRRALGNDANRDAGKRVKAKAPTARGQYAVRPAMAFEGADHPFSSRREFSVAARPFMVRSLEEYQEQMVAIIQNRIAEAVQA